jgi:protein tyrosine/serine phosphatase
VLADHGIRTVVTLRPDRGAAPNSDAHEDEICRARGVKFVRIPPRVAGEEEAGDAALDQVARAFLGVMDDPGNYPVLVHCTAGRDRTGTMCAVYRMEYDRWSPGDALSEMGHFGFDPERDAAARAYAHYVRSYRPRREPGRPIN